MTNVPAADFASGAFGSGGWQPYRLHRLMTYALIASKTATLMAIMIRKNFPIALPPADPNAKQQE
jgi:hypothetical protein